MDSLKILVRHLKEAFSNATKSSTAKTVISEPAPQPPQPTPPPDVKTVKKETLQKFSDAKRPLPSTIVLIYSQNAEVKMDGQMVEAKRSASVDMEAAQKSANFLMGEAKKGAMQEMDKIKQLSTGK